VPPNNFKTIVKMKKKIVHSNMTFTHLKEYIIEVIEKAVNKYVCKYNFLLSLKKLKCIKFVVQNRTSLTQV